MSKKNKLQCENCNQAEYGEDLFNYEDKILCKHCIVAKLYESNTKCEYIGSCNDIKSQSKDQHIKELENQLVDEIKRNTVINYQNICKIKELEEENRLLKNQVIEYKNRFNNKTEEVDYWKQQLHELPKKICDEIALKLKNKKNSYEEIHSKDIDFVLDEI